MLPDLGDMLCQGYLVSPQWEGELELDSASDYDNENEEVDSFVVQDRASESAPKDYISVVRVSSLWILIRDSLSPPDVVPGEGGVTRNYMENLLPYGSVS